MKAALIGAGQIAKQHLACLKELEGVEVGAVCDLSPATAAAAAERFGVPRWFTDHREMLEAERPDVVHVTTPPSSHFPLATAALGAGAHVIVEKPASETVEQLRQMVRVGTGRRTSAGGELQLSLQSRDAADPRGGPVRPRREGGACRGVDRAGHPGAEWLRGPQSPASGAADGRGRHRRLPAAPGLAGHAFVGPHRSAHPVWSKRARSPLPCDEFRALVDAERGTAGLGFSAQRPARRLLAPGLRRADAGVDQPVRDAADHRSGALGARGRCARCATGSREAR